ARTTHELVTRQFDVVLKRLIEVTERTVSETPNTDLSSLRANLERELRREFEAEIETTRRRERQHGIAMARRDRMRPLTDTEIEQANRILNEISATAAFALTRLSRSEEVAARHGQLGVDVESVPELEELQRFGLVV